MPRFDPNEYEDVNTRILRFRREHPTGRIETDIVAFDGEHGATRWIIKAKVYTNDDPASLPSGEGHAFEIDGGKGANATSALENGETSAVGRALAQAGFTGSKRATREEMLKVRTGEVTSRIREAQSEDELAAIYAELQADGIEKEFLGALGARKKDIQAKEG